MNCQIDFAMRGGENFKSGTSNQEDLRQLEVEIDEENGYLEGSNSGNNATTRIQSSPAKPLRAGEVEAWLVNVMWETLAMCEDQNAVKEYGFRRKFGDQ